MKKLCSQKTSFCPQKRTIAHLNASQIIVQLNRSITVVTGPTPSPLPLPDSLCYRTCGQFWCFCLMTRWLQMAFYWGLPSRDSKLTICSSLAFRDWSVAFWGQKEVFWGQKCLFISSHVDRCCHDMTSLFFCARIQISPALLYFETESKGPCRYGWQTSGGKLKLATRGLRICLSDIALFAHFASVAWRCWGKFANLGWPVWVCHQFATGGLPPYLQRP